MALNDWRLLPEKDIAYVGINIWANQMQFSSQGEPLANPHGKPFVSSAQELDDILEALKKFKAESQAEHPSAFIAIFTWINSSTGGLKVRIKADRAKTLLARQLQPAH